MVSVPAGLLEGDPGVSPSMHVFVSSKVPWVKLDDDLPKHEKWVPDSCPVTLLERKSVAARCGRGARRATDTPRCMGPSAGRYEGAKGLGSGWRARMKLPVRIQARCLDLMPHSLVEFVQAADVVVWIWVATSAARSAIARRRGDRPEPMSTIRSPLPAAV
jgi:hypothetical protein